MYVEDLVLLCSLLNGLVSTSLHGRIMFVEALVLLCSPLNGLVSTSLHNPHSHWAETLKIQK